MGERRKPIASPRVSTREQAFLHTQDAWALAMSGTCGDWREVEARVPRRDGQTFVAGSDLLRRKLDDVCARSRALLKAAVVLPTPARASPEDAIRSILTAENVAYYMRDYDGFIDLYLDDPRFRLLSWVHSGGMTDRSGFAALAAAWRDDIANFPLVNPYCAYGAVRVREVITVGNGMAWASYDLVYPVSDLPGYNGLGVSQEVRILERQGTTWRISFRCTIDDQFGQNTAPIWQVNDAGRVLGANPAAEELARHTDRISTRGGRIRLTGAENDRRLKEAIRSAAAVGHGVFSRYRARSLIFEPEDGSGSQAIWVVNQGSKVRVSLSSGATFEERLETATSAFGLSPAQCRLAACIVDGMSLTDAARQQGISASTARTQLQRIFDKVGVRTQPGLVSALIAAVEHAPLD